MFVISLIDNTFGNHNERTTYNGHDKDLKFRSQNILNIFHNHYYLLRKRIGVVNFFNDYFLR